MFPLAYSSLLFLSAWRRRKILAGRLFLWIIHPAIAYCLFELFGFILHMRIWDIAPKFLCRKHLLGEHRELHGLWSIHVNNKKGYSHHPETKRWKGKLKALYKRHDALVQEMKARGYNHLSPLDKKYAKGKGFQDELLDSISKQKKLLKEKPCGCFVEKFPK